MRATEILQEATFNLGQDVDLLYNLLFKDVIKNIHNEKWNGKYVMSHEPMTTAILKSKNARLAHAVNPMYIVTNRENVYDPHKSIISISINNSALDVIRAKDNSFEKALRYLKEYYPEQARRFVADLTESRVKGSIYHELSHWLDDTFHNKHLSKMLTKAQNQNSSKVTMQGERNVGLTKYEINAQIHSIKQMKRNYKKEWDMLSFNDMISHNASLMTISSKLNKADYNRWKKMLLKRMARENLLGIKMTKNVNYTK